MLVQVLLRRVSHVDEAEVRPLPEVRGGAAPDRPDAAAQFGVDAAAGGLPAPEVAHVLLLEGVPEHGGLSVEYRPLVAGGHQQRVPVDDLPSQAVRRGESPYVVAAVIHPAHGDGLVGLLGRGFGVTVEVDAADVRVVGVVGDHVVGPRAVDLGQAQVRPLPVDSVLALGVRGVRACALSRCAAGGARRVPHPVPAAVVDDRTGETDRALPRPVELQRHLARLRRMQPQLGAAHPVDEPVVDEQLQPGADLPRVVGVQLRLRLRESPVDGEINRRPRRIVGRPGRRRLPRRASSARPPRRDGRRRGRRPGGLSRAPAPAPAGRLPP